MLFLLNLPFTSFNEVPKDSAITVHPSSFEEDNSRSNSTHGSRSGVSGLVYRSGRDLSGVSV